MDPDTRHKLLCENSPVALKRLRNIIWLDVIFIDYGIDAKRLQELYSGYNDSSNIVNKWIRGESNATLKSAEYVAALPGLSGSDYIYKLPLFDLLENKRLTKIKLKEIVSPFIDTDNPLALWNFPFSQNGDSKLVAPIPIRDDLESLYYRDDIFGFIGILYHLRLADAKKDSDLFYLCLSYAYKAFPGLCKYRHFQKHWKELFQLFRQIAERQKIIYLHLPVDLDKLEKNIFNEEHRTNRIFWQRCKKSGKFIEPLPPYSI